MTITVHSFDVISTFDFAIRFWTFCFEYSVELFFYYFLFFCTEIVIYSFEQCFLWNPYQQIPFHLECKTALNWYRLFVLFYEKCRFLCFYLLLCKKQCIEDSNWGIFCIKNTTNICLNRKHSLPSIRHMISMFKHGKHQ